MRVLVSAGEVSGDIAGARVAEAILHRGGARVSGLGGARMAAAGVELLASATHLGTVGVSESLRAVPGMVRPVLALRKMMRDDPPDAALLIGNDIFNVLLGRWCRASGVPTVSYFPPQVWIWRSLAWLFSRSFDVVAASFPEEEETYARHVQTEFVGHYLADVLAPPTAKCRAEARAALGMQQGVRVVAVLPGSRGQEIRGLVPILLGAASRVAAAHDGVQLLLPLSDSRFEPEIVAGLEDAGLSTRVRIVSDSHLAMRASDLILAASGTATLEATLLGVPMVVVYRVSRLTHLVVKGAIAAGLMHGETVALPNLLLGRRVVPELTQSRATADAAAREALRLLADEEAMEVMRRDLRSARELVARGEAIDRVADLVCELAARRIARTEPRGALGLVGDAHATRGRT